MVSFKMFKTAPLKLFFSVIVLIPDLVAGQCEKSDVICVGGGNATFSQDYISIRVDFPTEVKPITAHNNCSGIIHPSILPTLGSSPICAFATTRTLDVFPDKDGTIRPDSVLMFKDDSIGSPNGTVLEISNVTLKTLPSSEIFQPSVILTESGIQSSCPNDQYFISGDYSKNSGFSPFVNYVWGLDTVVESTDIAADAALKSGPANRSEVKITDVIAAANRSIALQVFNVFGTRNNKTISLTSSDSLIARISGERIVYSHANDELRLVAELLTTKCEPLIKSIAYSWNVSKDMNPYNVDNLMHEEKVLRIRPYSFQGGAQFNISVSITYVLANNQTSTASDAIVVDVKKPRFKAEIIGGDREVGKDQNLTLAARQYANAKEALTYQWSCVDAVTGDVCKGKNGVSDLAFANAPAILVSVAGVNFTSGNRYKFTLTITSSIGTDSTSILVAVKKSNVPLLSVMSERRSWSHDENVTMRGVVFGVSGVVTFQWTVHDLFGNEITGTGLTGSTSNEVNHALAPTGLPLRISINTLSPEQTYQLTLKATTSSSSTQSSVLQRISMPPRHGHLDVTPMQGKAFNTTFRFRSHGWIDRQDRQPLQHRFGYIDEKRNIKRFLTIWKNYNIAPRVILPYTNSTSGETLTVFVEVRNSVGLIAQRQLKIQIQQNTDHNGLVGYTREMAVARENDSMSIAIIGLLKSELTIDSKRLHVSEYFAVVENSPYSPDLAMIFVHTMWEIALYDVGLSNSSNAVLTRAMKEKVIGLLAKLLNHLDVKENRFQIKMNQVSQISDIIDKTMPKPSSLSSSDAVVVNSLKSSANSLAKLACEAMEYNARPIKVSSSVLTLSTGWSTELLSLSRPYRETFYQTKCSQLNYFNCKKICIAVTSFRDLKYFMLDGSVSGMVTEIHEATLDGFGNVPSVESEDGFLFYLPVVHAYDKTAFDLQCLMLNTQTKAWSDEHCSVTSVDTNSGTETLHCKCSKLLPVVGATTVKASPSVASTTNIASSTTTTASTTEEPATTTSPAEIITLVLDGNCTKYLQSNVEQNFTTSLIINLAYQLRIEESRIQILELACGSIIVNMTIKEKSPSAREPTKQAALSTLKGLLSTGYMRVTLYDGVLAAAAPGVNISIPPTMPPMTTKKLVIPEFNINWTPLFISFTVVLGFIISVSVFVAWLHGRYYKKKQYTDINSNRKKPVVPSQKVLNKRQKMKKFESIMEDSLENHSSTLAAGSTSTLKMPKRSRVGAVASLALPVTKNAMMNRNLFSASQQSRELPRLALDDSSSESESETSFSTPTPRNNERPKSADKDEESRAGMSYA